MPASTATTYHTETDIPSSRGPKLTPLSRRAGGPAPVTGPAESTLGNRTMAALLSGHQQPLAPVPTTAPVAREADSSAPDLDDDLDGDLECDLESDAPGRWTPGTDTSEPANGEPADPDAEIAAMAPEEKLWLAWLHATEMVGPEVRERLESMVTPSSLTMLATFGIMYAAAHLTPAGWVADGFALATLTIAAVFVGAEVLNVAVNLATFAGAAQASSEEELERSGEALAEALVGGGLLIVASVLGRAAGGAARGRGYREPPPPGSVDVVTAEGLLVQVPAQAAPSLPVPASALQQGLYRSPTPLPGAPKRKGGRRSRKERRRRAKPEEREGLVGGDKQRVPGSGESPIWRGLDNYRGGIKVQGKGRKRRFYLWDHLHGEIEMFDHHGRHLGAINPFDGAKLKPPKPGRGITVD